MLHNSKVILCEHFPLAFSHRLKAVYKEHWKKDKKTQQRWYSINRSIFISIRFPRGSLKMYERKKDTMDEWISKVAEYLRLDYIKYKSRVKSDKSD